MEDDQPLNRFENVSLPELEWANVGLPWVELPIGLVTFGLNVIQIRSIFKNKHQFDDFGRTLVGINFIINFAHIFHPLAWIVFVDRRPITREAYYEAVLHYVFHFLAHVGMMFQHIKFFVFASERYLAMRSGTFEVRHVSGEVLAGSILLVAFQVVLKAVFYLCFDTEDPVDLRILKGLTADGSPAFFLSSHIIYYVGIVVGCLMFRLLHKQVVRYREDHHTRRAKRLTKVTHTLKPLLEGELACCLFTTPVFVLLVLIALGHNNEWWMALYEVATKFNYFCVGLLILYSTIVAIRRYGLTHSLIKSDMDVMTFTMSEKQRVRD